MADPLTILQQAFNIVVTIRNALKQAGDNREDCRSILELVDDVNTVIGELQRTPIMENKAMIRITERLKGGLQRASDRVTAWQKKSFLRHAVEADGVADELRNIYRDISLDLALANLATNADTHSLIRRLLEKLALPQLESMVAVAANNQQTNMVPGEPSSDKLVPRRRSSGDSKLLEIHPLELRFPLERNKEAIICPVSITNGMEHYVGVWISPTNNHLFTCPTRAIVVEPRSTLAVPVTMKMHRQPPRDMGKFYVLMFVAQSKDDLVGFLNRNSDSTVPVQEAEKLQIEVYWEELTAITCEPAICQIITGSTRGNITCTDVHPSKTWIVTGHLGGYVSIWDYKHQQQETAKKRQITGTSSHRICSTKFIAQQKWLAVGDDDGYIHVYRYADDATLYEPKKFEAYSKGVSVDLLVVHPSRKYILSSSKGDPNIMLWDWEGNWNKILNFNVNSKGVCSLKFNPMGSRSYPCVTFANRAQVWCNTRFPRPTIKLEATFRAHHFNHDNQLYLATLRSPREGTDVVRTAPNAQISKLDLDRERKEVVHTLGVTGRQMGDVAHHPKLPILATTLDDGTVCLWDSRTWRLEKMIHITNCLPRALRFCEDINGLIRLYVRFNSILAILEVNLPMASRS